MADGRLRRARLAFERNFTQIPNEWVRDERLSLKARGLLTMLMSHDEGYTVTYKSLAATNKEGLAAIETAVRELKEQGYLDVVKSRGRNGRIEGWIWELTDPVEVRKRRSVPLIGFPESGLSELGENRNTDNRHLKEQQLQEHLTQVPRTGDGTRVGINEDASGDSHQAAIETLEQAFERSLHARCTFYHRGQRECSWAASGYCDNCGRARPSFIPEIVYEFDGSST